MTYKEAIESLQPVADYTPLASYGAALNMAIDALRKVDAGPWISVDDRLPKPGYTVLCLGRCGGVFFGRNPKRNDKNRYYFDSYQCMNPRIATHWMPLPEAPKGE